MDHSTDGTLHQKGKKKERNHQIEFNDLNICFGDSGLRPLPVCELEERSAEFTEMRRSKD